MRLRFGARVFCEGKRVGRLADVVLDPARRVTHIVIKPRFGFSGAEARLVPLELARSRGTRIRLDCTRQQFESQEAIQEVAFLTAGAELPHDAERDVGVSDVLPPNPAMPGELGVDAYPLRLGVTYDLIPRGDAELREASVLISADGHDLGGIDGLDVGDAGEVMQLVLERRHLARHRELHIPIAAVQQIESDRLVLDLSRDEVKEIRPTRPTSD